MRYGLYSTPPFHLWRFAPCQRQNGMHSTGRSTTDTKLNDPTLQERSLLQQATVLGALNRHLAPIMAQTLTSWVLLLSLLIPRLAIYRSFNMFL